MLVIIALLISAHLSFFKTLVKTKDSKKRKLLMKYYRNVTVHYMDNVNYISGELAKKEDVSENIKFVTYVLDLNDYDDLEAINIFNSPN